MDKHILKLAMDAGLFYQYGTGSDEADWNERCQEFARSIAKECANLDAQLKHNPNLEKFPFYHAQMAGIDMLVQAIRAKFGVGA